MEAFVDYLAMGAITVGPLIERQCALDEVPVAYEEIRENGAYTVLIRYPALGQETALSSSKNGHTVLRKPLEGRLRVGCIGAGSFARDVTFPHLRKIRTVELEAVATATGVGAESARKASGFKRACTPDELIEDPNIGAVFILTRHDSHAGYLLKALKQGKSLFIEKPLCARREELEAIQLAYTCEQEKGAKPFVMVGFNRRFAPHSKRLKEFFSNRSEPMAVQMRVNAGYISANHWVQQASGGRIVGELCHFVDWARFLVGRRIVSTSTMALPDRSKYSSDNITATLGFEDGSIATLLYLANGDKAVPKEYFEVFCEGKVAQLEDFRRLALSSNGKTQQFKASQDKGHERELELTIKELTSGAPSPILFDELCEVTSVTFQIEEGLRKSLSTSPVGTERIQMPVEPVELEETPKTSNSSAGDLGDEGSKTDGSPSISMSRD